MRKSVEGSKIFNAFIIETITLCGIIKKVNGELTDMIRKLQKTDINQVSHIWLNTNLKAHFFIPEQYWISNYEFCERNVASIGSLCV